MGFSLTTRGRGMFYLPSPCGPRGCVMASTALKSAMLLPIMVLPKKTRTSKKIRRNCLRSIKNYDYGISYISVRLCTKYVTTNTKDFLPTYHST
jgi:hypothetical protein